MDGAKTNGCCLRIEMTGHDIIPGATDAPSASPLMPVGRFILLVALLVFAAYPDVCLGVAVFFHRDFSAFGFPLAAYYRESFAAGQWPLWNPLSNCGIPFLAQWSPLCFYPPALLFLVAGDTYSISLFCLAHQCLGGLGAYWLARRWTGNTLAAGVAGVGYALHGLMFNSLMWPHFIAGLSWAPWLMGAVERGCERGKTSLAWAVAVGAMQMATGAVEAILFSWVLAGGLVLFKPGNQPGEAGRPMRLLRLAVMVAWISALAAVQLLPFFELLSASQRNVNFDNSSWSMPLWGVANLLVPIYGCIPSTSGVYSQYVQEWTSSYYPGLAVVLLAGVALQKSRNYRVIFLWVALALGVVLAAGEPGRVLPFMRSICPPLQFIRFPVKFLIVSMLAFPLLAAYGVRWLVEDGGMRAKIRTLLWHGSFYVVCVAIILISTVWIVNYESYRMPAIWNGFWRVVCAGAALGALMWLAPRPDTRLKYLMALVFLGILGLDFVTHMSRQNPTVAKEIYKPGLNPLLLKPLPNGSRIMVSPKMFNTMLRTGSTNPVEYGLKHRTALVWNWNLVDSLPKVDGFFPLYTREQSHVFDALYGLGTNGLAPGVLDYLGVARISSDERLFEWDDRATWLPLVTAGQTPVFTNYAGGLYGLLARDYDPRHGLLLPEEERVHIQAQAAPSATVSNIQIAPHQIRFVVQSSLVATQSMLVSIAQTHFRPWKAYVDDTPTPIFRANHAFQAIQVPGGTHQVVLRYEDRAFSLGWKISLAALGCWLIYFMMNAIRSRTGLTPAAVGGAKQSE